VGTKAYYVREGVFEDVDLVLFSHVDDNLATSWGDVSGNGLVSVLFSFQGRSAHAAGAPWRGRSALDAVELMDIGWNFRREHLRLQQRSHYVIPNGGDQPNVVPPTASVWYYLRELDYQHIQEMFALADTMARAAAMMTSTTLLPERILGSAWPGHFNRVVAEDMYENIKQVGLPEWSAADQGATAGAKVMAMTVLDFLMRPELVTGAWDYFRNVQTKDIKYQPLIRPQDRPAIELNRDVMARFRPQMRRFYYDPSKYRTYL